MLSDKQSTVVRIILSVGVAERIGVVILIIVIVIVGVHVQINKMI